MARLRHAALLGAGIGLIVAGGLIPAEVASATPYTDQATCAVSSGSPSPGSVIRISGAGFHARTTVAITLGAGVPRRLGTTGTDAAGSFGMSLQLPTGLDGAHTLVVHDMRSGDSCSAALGMGDGTGGESVGPNGGGRAVVDPNTGTGTGVGSGLSSNAGTGGTAYTGVAVAGIGGIGVLLLLGGGALLVAGRHRRTDAA